MVRSAIETHRSSTGALREIRWSAPDRAPGRLRLAPDDRTVLLEERGSPGSRPVPGPPAGATAVATCDTWCPLEHWDRPGTHTLREAIEPRVAADDLGAVLALLRGLVYR